ncbi:type II toxin-antitoxin system CcdA family antitoxin [Roseivivax sp. THAF197b]|uniref:type II toxin-antitoxin system CcdA family antitoxin n=1 Tax=Roseivivax sp. THAF197b TaxID=2588299 RepID=UPI0020C78AA6|nr:type II toxin-antitoxin system CcdA family antitoxin [Roseivivax sp. THAF197b]
MKLKQSTTRLLYTPSVCTVWIEGEHTKMQSKREKQRTNVSLTPANLTAARELGLNVSAISDAAVAEAVRVARAEAWAAENASAISERRAWIDANGTPLADLQVLRSD